MKVIAFGTLKGGTGKTTVAFNIGGILAEEHKVLFIDVDPQCNLSDNAGVDTADQDGATIRDVFDNPNKVTAGEVITSEPLWQLPNLDIISSHIRLTATELQLVSAPAREKILKVITDCIAAPREDVSANAPRIVKIQINPDKIGALIYLLKRLI